VGVSNAEVHIGEFADFSQAFRLREGTIILSTETGIKCFGGAFWEFPCGVWLALFSGLIRKAILKQAKAETPSDTVPTASHRRHNGIRCSVSD